MIYNNVKKLCSENGISVSHLERELEFPRSSVSKWNDNTPAVTKVQKVASYFNVPIEQLLEE